MKNRTSDFLPAAWRPRDSGESPRAGMGSKELLRVLKPVEELVAKHPAAALAVAFAAGVALAWWIKRK